MKKTKTIAVLTAAAGLVGVGTAAPSHAATGSYKNCTALNKVYPHGVGRPAARR